MESNVKRPKNNEESTTVAEVIVDLLNVRESPGFNTPIVGTLEEGDRVSLTQIAGEWGKTDKGWICLKFIRKTEGKANNA